MAAIEYKNSLGTYKLNTSTFLGLVLVSTVYFADLFVKASHKCFWLDELFTTYLCRLPDFKSTWAAVTRGADFNPPMLYLLTRGVQWLFGEGLIATRLPAMIGVWIFGICLFLFVARRAGVFSGIIAGTFPFFTLAQFYSYEARAHGIVLGWCGLMLVCWQRSEEGRAKYQWLAGFGLCFVGALLTHVYAVYLVVPFALVESYNLLNARRLNWGILGVTLLALMSVTVAVYLPLFRLYRASVPSTFRPGSHDLIQRFLVNSIGPGMIVLVLWLLLSALDGSWLRRHPNAEACLPRRELLIAVGFACIPLVGLLGSKVSHGPFIDRYFLSSIAGYAILLGFACSRIQVNSSTAQVLAGCLLFLMLADLGATIYLSFKQRLMLREPSIGIPIGTTPSDPMRLYDTLSKNKGLDILVLPELEYLYFFRYAPAAVVSHLYFGAPRDDLFLSAYERLALGARIDLKTTTYGPFLATHKRFMVYEDSDRTHIEAIEAIASAGYTLKSARPDATGVMYEYAK